MKQIESIYASHADMPSIDFNLDLNAWKVDKFDDLDKLVQYVIEELKEIWMYHNGKFVADTTMPITEMIKYFWSKRPTSITISFKGGTKSVYTIDYPKDANTFPNILHENPDGWKKMSTKIGTSP